MSRRVVNLKHSAGFDGWFAGPMREAARSTIRLAQRRACRYHRPPSAGSRLPSVIGATGAKRRSVVLALCVAAAVLAGCGERPTGGRYYTGAYSVDREDTSRFSRLLAKDDLPPGLALRFWTFLRVEGRRYLVVYADHGDERIFLHLLVRGTDPDLTALAGGEAQRGTLLEGLRWRYEVVDSEEEMLYEGMSPLAR